MTKSWFSSRTILGGITWALGKLADPAVLDLAHSLPLNETQRVKVAGIVQAAGALVAIFGIRRAIPTAALFPTDEGVVRVPLVPTSASSGLVNEHGETPAQERARRAIMDAKGVELMRTLEARESGGKPRSG